MSAAKTRPRTPARTSKARPGPRPALGRRPDADARTDVGTPAKKKRARTRPGRDRRDGREEQKTPEAKDAAKLARVLSGKAARYLRGLGHHLEPIVQIGKDGITDGVVAAMREALLAHELVKVRVLAEAPVDRRVAGAELADRAGASLAQTLGRTLLLYKRHPQKPKIVLPA